MDEYGSITAGKGTDGEAGTTLADAVNGPNAKGQAGGAGFSGAAAEKANKVPAQGGTNTCSDEAAGGAGALAPFYASSANGCYPLIPFQPAVVKSGNAGKNGDDGVSAIGTGVFNANGYVPADGTPGKNGSPGSGGSGAGGPSIGVAYTSGTPNFANSAKAKAGTPGAGVGQDSKTFESMTWTLPASAAGMRKTCIRFERTAFDLTRSRWPSAR